MGLNKYEKLANKLRKELEKGNFKDEKEKVNSFIEMLEMKETSIEGKEQIVIMVNNLFVDQKAIEIKKEEGEQHLIVKELSNALENWAWCFTKERRELCNYLIASLTDPNTSKEEKEKLYEQAEEQRLIINCNYSLYQAEIIAKNISSDENIDEMIELCRLSDQLVRASSKDKYNSYQNLKSNINRLVARFGEEILVDKNEITLDGKGKR